MAAIDLTFELLAEVLTREATTPQIGKNLVSALRKFVDWRGMSMSDVVGSVLRGDFYRHRKAHLAHLADEGRPPTYIENRSSLLSKARATVARLDRLAALKSKEETPLQTALHDLVEKAGGAKLLSRKAKIPLRKLEGYLRGIVPGRNGDRELQKVERYFAMPAGALTDLIPRRGRRPWSKTGRRVALPSKDKLSTSYGKYLAICKKDPYRLKPSEFSEELRAQWRALLDFKTDMWGLWASIVTQKGKLSRRWHCMPFPRPMRADDWVATVNGQWCPSAKINFEVLSNFLGWLARDASKGGGGLSIEQVQTMAWFVDAQYLRNYCEWLITRGGGISSAVTRVLTFAAAHCQPERGFLWHSPEIGHRAGYSTEDWRAQCAQAFAAYRLAQKNFKTRVSTKRNPFDRVASLIALDEPMKAVWDAMDRMRQDRPPPGGEAELVWARNYLLLGLFASNPLRVRNMKELTWRDDNTGDLRKDPDGHYRIFIPGPRMKNRYGFALSRDYDVPVQTALTAIIDEYLERYWPRLTKGRTDRIFVGTTDPERVWNYLPDAFYDITTKCFVGTPGFRPHAMRHITATALIKETGGFTAAALVLHDKESTVRQHYGFVVGNDAARWMAALWKGGRKRAC